MTDLEKALEKLDLKGLLVLQGLINQQALKYVLDAEPLTKKFKAKASSASRVKREVKTRV